VSKPAPVSKRPAVPPPPPKIEAPAKVELPPKVAPPANPAIAKESDPAGIYSDLYGDMAEPADPNRPNTLLRPPADSAICRLTNVREGASKDDPSQPALLIDFEQLCRGFKKPNRLVIRSGDGQERHMPLALNHERPRERSNWCTDCRR